MNIQGVRFQLVPCITVRNRTIFYKNVALIFTRHFIKVTSVIIADNLKLVKIYKCILVISSNPSPSVTHLEDPLNSNISKQYYN